MLRSFFPKGLFGVILIHSWVMFLGTVVAPLALAQTPPTVTLTVPDGTEFAEGEGNTTVTVTATLSPPNSNSETVIDLSLAGTAKTTDYSIVGSLPDITIPSGQTVGTADLTLSPVDDNFFEGLETVIINGTVTGSNLSVDNVEIDLTDNEEKPSIRLQVWSGTEYRTLQPSGITHVEGDIISLRIEVFLAGTVTFEEDKIVRVSHHNDTVNTGVAELDDLNFGTNPLPWDITISAGSRRGHRDVNIEIVDDDDREIGETFSLKTELTTSGIEFTDTFQIFSIEQSDLPQAITHNCDRITPHYPNDSIDVKCRVKGRHAFDKDYTVTYTAEKPTLIDPDEISYVIKKGTTQSEDKTVTFETKSHQKKTISSIKYTPEVKPERPKEAIVSDYHVAVYPDPDADFQIGGSEENLQIFSGSKTLYKLESILLARITTPRPSILLAPAEFEVQLDSGRKTVTCELTSPTPLGRTHRCHLQINRGDFDFDGKLVIPKGAFNFGGWRDTKDSSVSGSANPNFPTQEMEAEGFFIYGGSHGIRLSINQSTLQEGMGEQVLTVTAVNVSGRSLPNDLNIPLKFTNISTSDADYKVSGDLQITIPKGQLEGSTEVTFTRLTI